jgi:hypothetical protein
MIEPSGDEDATARPTTSHRKPATRPAILSRRSLLGAGAVLAAGGAGAGIAGLRPERRRPAAHPDASAALRSALAREESLRSGLDAALRRGSERAVELRAARDDHAVHATALRSAISAYPAPSASTTPLAAPPSSVTPTIAQLRAAEVAAAGSAAAESTSVAGADAALLASISACEATHAELFA